MSVLTFVTGMIFLKLIFIYIIPLIVCTAYDSDHTPHYHFTKVVQNGTISMSRGRHVYNW